MLGVPEDEGDLVAKLRRAANGCRSFKSGKGDFGLADDAADEIERLRAALEKIASGTEPVRDGDGRRCAHRRSYDDDCVFCARAFAREVMSN